VVYLYAAMGAVMMTGIMTVVEMGLSLTGQSLLSKPDDPYQQNRLAGKRDQDMLRLLHNPDDLDDLGRSLQGAELCKKLLTVARNAGARFPYLQDLSQAGVASQAEDSDKECILQTGNYRMLIQPDPAPSDPEVPYRLISCVLSRASTCEFDSNG